MIQAAPLQVTHSLQDYDFHQLRAIYTLRPATRSSRRPLLSASLLPILATASIMVKTNSRSAGLDIFFFYLVGYFLNKPLIP